MVNSARTAAVACAITTLISDLSSLFQPSCILLYLNQEAYHNHRKRLCEMFHLFLSRYTSVRSERKNRSDVSEYVLEELVFGGTIF